MLKHFVLILLSIFALGSAQEQQLTLSLIKPEAVAAGHVGEILARFEKGGLKIAGIKMVKLSKQQAEQFYAVHKDRPFYADLTTYISSGPIVATVLASPTAVAKNRELMGATDPKKAAPGTIRADFAESIQRNAVHGSDSIENATTEIAFFFKPEEILNK